MTHLNQFLNKTFFPYLDRHLKNKWIIKTVLLALFISILSSSPSSISPPFPQYFLKFHNPFFDMLGSGIPEATQAANTNYRLTVPIIFNTFKIFHPYALPILLVASVVCSIATFALISFQVFRDKKIAFLATLYMAVTYNGSFSYPSTTYDQFALLLVFLSMIRFRYLGWLLTGLLVFAALWTDERAYLACFATLGIHLLRESTRDKTYTLPTLKDLFFGLKSPIVLSTMIAYLAAFLSRIWVQNHYHFSLPVGSGAVFNAWIMNIRYYHVGSYFFLEGAWLIVVVTSFLLLKYKHYVCGAIVLLIGIPYCYASFSVFDITRTLSYLFPSVLVVFYMLNGITKPTTQRTLMFWVFIISLVGGNYVIHSHKEGMLRWIRPLPLKMVEDKLMVMRADFLSSQGRDEEI